jgi:predicted GNAT family N-acyltransferase
MIQLSFIMFSLISKKTAELTSREIIKICKLKDTFWRFGSQIQKKWFKKTIFKNDIHNMFFKGNDLIGYTCLRIRKYNKHKKYLIFDTLIIHKKFRKKRYSSNLMNFNNIIIESKKMMAFLICDKNLVSFYKKFGWILFKDKNSKIIDHKKAKVSMSLNINKLKNFKNHIKNWIKD